MRCKVSSVDTVCFHAVLGHEDAFCGDQRYLVGQDSICGSVDGDRGLWIINLGNGQ